MDETNKTPFDSLESAHEYLHLLSESLLEAKRDIEEDISARAESGALRHVEALRLVLYKLDKLDHHVTTSRRLLNDLRTLRRLLLNERAATMQQKPK